MNASPDGGVVAELRAEKICGNRLAEQAVRTITGSNVRTEGSVCWRGHESSWRIGHSPEVNPEVDFTVRSQGWPASGLAPLSIGYAENPRLPVFKGIVVMAKPIVVLQSPADVAARSSRKMLILRSPSLMYNYSGIPPFG